MKFIKWILSGVTLISTIIMLFIFPDTIPVHFDINGVVDRWGSKYEMLVLPVVMFLSIFMFDKIMKDYLKKADSGDDEKQKAELLSNIKVIKISVWIMLILFAVINAFLLYTSCSQVYPEKNLPSLDITKAVTITMGITFIVMGNYIPKTRRNRSIGFRFPWTLYNDTTWNKSNRFSSHVMIIAGSISIIAALFVKKFISTLIMIGSLLISIIIIMIYAYIIYRKERKKDNERTN